MSDTATSPLDGGWAASPNSPYGDYRLHSADFDRLIQVAEQNGEMVQWCPSGQPPDQLVCSMLIPSEKVATVTAELLDIGRSRLSLTLYPFGVPKPNRVLFLLGRNPGDQGRNLL